MHTAYVNASSIRFPKKCPHCGRKADGTYAVTAMRGLDAFIGSYTVPLLLDVPVCRAAFERRRRAALVSLVVVLGVIVANGAAALVFAFKAKWIPAMLLGAVAAGFGAGGRTGWDAAALDRWILGVYVRSVSSARLLMGFRSDKYFAEWTGLNRSASQAR